MEKIKFGKKWRQKILGKKYFEKKDDKKMYNKINWYDGVFVKKKIWKKNVGKKNFGKS